jgi:prepilin-type N-terminal cleavage/methylation domain-containing protein
MEINRYCANKGFTLIELLIVICIIGIIAAIGSFQANKYVQNQNLREEALAIKTCFQQTKSLAQSKSISYDIDFDVTGNRYTMWTAAGSSFYTPADPRVRITSVDFSGGLTVRILARGLTDHLTGQNQNGTVTLTNAIGSTSTITMTNPGGRIFITNDMN